MIDLICRRSSVVQSFDGVRRRAVAMCAGARCTLAQLSIEHCVETPTDRHIIREMRWTEVLSIDEATEGA